MASRKLAYADKKEGEIPTVGRAHFDNQWDADNGYPKPPSPG